MVADLNYPPASPVSGLRFLLSSGQVALSAMILLLAANHAIASVADGRSGISGRPATILDIETGLRHFGSVEVSAKAAVEAAERALGGASIVDVGFDVQNGIPLYRAKAEIGGNIIDATIDASSSAVARSPSAADMSEDDRIKVAEFKRLGIKLTEAISVGETYGSGRAVSASLDQFDGRLIFLVVVVSKGYLKQVSIDPTNEAERRRSGNVDNPAGRSWTLWQSPRPPLAIR